MSRNVGITVGALLRRSAADHALPPLFPLSRANLFIPSVLRASHPSPRAFSSLRDYTASTPFRISNVPTRTLRTSAILGIDATRPSIAPGEVTRAVFSAWRNVHCKACSAKKRRHSGGRRNKSTKSPSPDTTPRSSPQTASPSAPQAELSPNPKSSEQSKNPSGTAYPESSNSEKTFYERLPQSLPHFHRPTKAELLAAATGFWSRLKVRFKWHTIKSARPFNVDEITALISWVLAAHFLWIILGTTTFFSLVVFSINTVFAQETLAQWIGNYLTQSSGIKVVFESAVVPKWKDGVISFKKVFVSRRPGQGRSNVSKGSQTSAAAAAAAIAQKEREHADGIQEEEDTNYTQYDISIDTVNVTLSFTKWFNGKGLLKDVEIKGIRGVVDRTLVYTPAEYVDPRIYKHEHQPGDFELDSFKMEDLLVTVYQPNNFRPYSVSIYSCDLPQLRKQWLFYDFLSANMMSGSFDNSLFTIHPRQTHNYTGSQLAEGREGQDGHSWKKHSRIRIDGLNIDHLNRGYEGPFSWIHEGNVDIISDIMIPNENDESIAKVMSDMYDRVEATVTSSHWHALHESHESDHKDTTQSSDKSIAQDEDKRFIIMDIRVQLNDVRAAVPIFTKDISYVNNALVRPIVAYMNAKRTFIPVNCRVVKRASEFDGSWTLYDSGLMDDVSREMYDAFARDVTDDTTARKRRIKKVGIWTLQLAAQALFIGLAGNIA